MSRPRVLVVEDNPVVAGMIRRFLKKSDVALMDVEPFTGNSGDETVSRAGNILGVVLVCRVERIA